MVDKDILWAKISALSRHLGRIKAKREVSLQDFLEDLEKFAQVISGRFAVV